MRKNEKLISIRPYQTSSGEWYLELTYAYEDEKAKHNVIFPKVLCPFPATMIPFPNSWEEARSYACSSGYSIPGLDQIPLEKEVCRLAQERGTMDPAYAFDIITKYFVREMTLNEIEEKLGYKVKIVTREKE